MKILVTGSLGNISKPLAERLVQQAHTVTIISQDPGRQAAIEALGATAAIGSVTDADFLTRAFTGADAVYAMIPPNFAAPDNRAYYRTVGTAYAQAVRAAGVRRVVHLSSWGAEQPQGTGFILGSHDVEAILDGLPNLSVTHLRAGSIYYNLLHLIGMVKQAGFMGAIYGGDDLVVLVAPVDIAAAAAEELNKTSAERVRYVASDERSATEIARILGAAIGQPALQWRTFTPEETRAAMVRRNMSEEVIRNSIELNQAIHTGLLRRGYEQQKPASLGQVKLEDYARDFAKAYNGEVH